MVERDTHLVDLELERTVLGEMLLDEGALNTGIERLKAEDFGSEVHRIIFRALVELWFERKVADVILLKEHLARKNLLEKVGGLDYLYSIVQSSLSPKLIDEHIELLLQKSLYRQLVELASEIQSKAQKGSMDANALLDFAEKRIIELRERDVRKGFIHIGEAVEEEIRAIETRKNETKDIMGIPTGIRGLDRLTGGFLPGQLIIIASRPGMGKTSFALNIHSNFSIKMGKPSAIFSLEMTAQELAQRFLAMESGISGIKLRKGDVSSSEFPRLVEAVSKLKDAPIYVDEEATTLLEIKARARRIVREKGVSLLTIDYLQLISLVGESRRAENRQQEISYITRTLKNFAKELGIPIIALSQLSRKVEDRADKKPRLSDLRESGAIEQDADIVIFLYRDESKEDSMTEYIVAKNRNGPQGEGEMLFIRETFKFTDNIYYDYQPDENADDLGELL